MFITKIIYIIITIIIPDVLFIIYNHHFLRGVFSEISGLLVLTHRSARAAFLSFLAETSSCSATVKKCDRNMRRRVQSMTGQTC